MSIQITKKAITWPYTFSLIEFLISSRDSVSEPLLRAGINHSIIFNSACFIEGLLEATLKEMLKRRREIFHGIGKPEFSARKTTNTLFNGLVGDLEQRISRATGADAYNDLFGVITGMKLTEREPIKAKWEGIATLFQFRNVLAHGREISASQMKAYWIEQPWLDQYTGGYKRAEDYLKKHQLITERFWTTKNEHLYFSDQISDHFWSVALGFVRTVYECSDADDQQALAHWFDNINGYENQDEQDVASQSATRSESDSEDGGKP